MTPSRFFCPRIADPRRGSRRKNGIRFSGPADVEASSHTPWPIRDPNARDFRPRRIDEAVRRREYPESMSNGKADPKKKFTSKLLMRSLTGSAGPQEVHVGTEQKASVPKKKQD